MVELFLLAVEHEGVAARLLLNDVPMRTLTAERPVETMDPVNQWIAPGENAVAVEILAPPEPGARLAVRVRRQPQDGSGAPAVLARIDVDLAALSAAALPARESAAFRVDDPPPTCVWPELSPIVMTDAARADALALLDDLNAALDAKDLDAASRLLGPKAVEMADAYGLPRPEAVPRQREFFEGLMEEDGWGMDPPPPEGFVLAPVTDGRMIWATRGGEEPALRSNGAGVVTFRLPVYLAPIRGTWTVVR